MFVHIYRAIGAAVCPFALPFIRRGHEIGERERRGLYDEAKIREIGAASRGSNIWVHAVSVGETQAASSVVLASRAAGYDRAITFSTVTATGAKAAGDLIGGAMTAHIYAPWDFPLFTRRAVSSISPSLYAAAESEIWPSLLYDLTRRGIPAMLFNARVSDRTWARRHRAAVFYRAALSMFSLILARADVDRERFIELGARPDAVRTAGDPKVDAIIARVARARDDTEALRRRLGEGRIITAGSTHEGEEPVILAAWQTLRARGHDVRLVIAPRHPERASAVLDLASSAGRAALWSGYDRAEGADIIVVDTIGALFCLYGTSDAATVGGSFVPRGGQNIIEPAAWGTPCAHGPHMEDFAAVTAELDATGDAAEARDAAELADIWERWLARPREADTPRMSNYMKINAGAARRIWDEMARLAKIG